MRGHDKVYRISLQNLVHQINADLLDDMDLIRLQHAPSDLTKKYVCHLVNYDDQEFF